MDLDKLKQVWETQDTRSWMPIQQELLTNSSILKVRSKLYEVKWENLIELLISVPFFMFIVSFTIDQWENPYLFYPSLGILLFSIASIAFNAYQLYLYYGINPQNGILENQRRVEQIRYNRLMEINALLVIIPLFSVPFLLIGAKLILGFDLWELGSTLISFFLGSIGVAIIIVFLLRRFPNKALEESSQFLQELRDWEQL